jgi:hypothetical protein
VRWLAAVLVYAVAAVVLTWPLAAGPTSHLVSDRSAMGTPPDLLHLVWTLTHVAHALTTDPTRLFEGNAFHPAPHVIAASEHMLGNQLLFAPMWLATGNPVLALNCFALATFVLSGLTMHLLVHRWTGVTAAAYVAGLAFAFAPWHLKALRLPHLLSVQYLPLVALGLDRVARGGGAGAVALTAAALGLQTLCSYYLGYGAFVLAGALVAADWLVRGLRGRWRIVGRELAAVALLPLVLVLPVTIPYLAMQRHGALDHFWFPFAVEAVSGRVWHAAVTWVGPGVLVLALAALAGAIAQRAPDRDVRARLLGVTLAGLLAFGLAAGPAGLGRGLSLFAWLAPVVPGLENVRDPHRFLIVLGFAASVLAGLGVAEAAAARARLSEVALGTLAAAAVLGPVAAGSYLRSHPVPTAQTLPPAHRWLAQNGAGGALLELPIGERPGFDQQQGAAWAMYLSTFHWLPLLNGHTSYPPAWWRLVAGWAEQLPAEEALEALEAATGLRWILVHDEPPGRAAAWSALGDARLRAEFPGPRGGRLYEVLDPPARAAARDAAADRTLEGNPAREIDAFAGTLSLAGLPSVVPAGGESRVTITVENRGREPWPTTAVDPYLRVFLRLRWLRAAQPEGSAAKQDVFVPRDVPAGGTVAFTAWVRHPPRVGRWVLQAGPVQGRPPAPWTPIVWTERQVVAVP